MIKNIAFSFCIILICFLFFLLSKSPYVKRGDKASEYNQIVVGIVDSYNHKSYFYEGVKLAAEDLNSTGGVLGKKIKLLYYDDKNDIKKGEQISKRIAKNEKVLAVIGHRNPAIAVNASITYKNEGIIFISPGVDLNRYGGDFIFRQSLSDENLCEEIADFALRQKYNNLIILYDISTETKQFTELFKEVSEKKHLNIVAEKFYSTHNSDKPDYRLLLTQTFKNKKYDAIFLSGVLPSAAELIKQIREVGINVPIIGTHRLNYDELWTIAGKAAEDTIINTSFDQNLPSNCTQKFVKQFKKKYVYAPDALAAQGYDALKLLAFSINKGDSQRPVVIDTTLRCIKEWRGVSGDYIISKNGSICPNQIFFKQFKSGMFEFIEDHFENNIGFDLVKDITIRLPVNGVISTLDPGYTYDETSSEVIEQLFLGLTDFDPKTYEIIPELALSWTSSSDNQIYTFTMRKDCVWTNGEPVTAHDIVWAIHRNIKPENKCPLAYMLYTLKNAQKIHNTKKKVDEVGVKAIDDYTVQFNLEHSASYFPALTGLPIFRPLNGKAIETHGKKWIRPKNIQTNGSYRLVNWNKGSLLILRKNAKYFDSNTVSIKEIRYYVIQNNALGLSMYLCDELDILGASYLKIPTNQLPFIQSHPVLRTQYYKDSRLNVYGYGFNISLYPVDSLLVRKAIISAIDRKRLIKLVSKGGENLAKTLTPPPIFGAVDKKEGIGIDFNPVLAKKLLDQAGYPNGKYFPDIELSFNTSEFHAQIAHAIALFLETYLNIKVKICEMPWSFYSNPDRSSTHMFRFAWTADYPDANNFLNEQFHPYKSSNKICWNNNKFAEIVEMAAIEADSEKRKEYYKQAEKILVEEEAAFIPLFYENVHCLVKERVKNWYYMVMGGQHIRDWYLK